MTRRRVVSTGAESVPVTIGPGDRVLVRETALTVVSAGAGAWRVGGNAGARLAYAARSPEGWWVHLDGAVFLLEIGDEERPEARKRQDAGGSLMAPMPATVLSIVAPAGTAVTAGETLLLLEAMKMELPIRAPRDGVVAAVHCREGELVQPGVTLVDLA